MSRPLVATMALIAGTSLGLTAAEPSFVRPVEAPGQAPDEPLVVTRGNISAQREYAGGTSSYYDLRLGDAGIIGGLPMAWPHALVGIGVRQREIFRDAKSAVIQPPGLPFAPGAEDATETHTDVTLTYRQGLWTPWAWDAELLVELGTGTMEAEIDSVVAGTYSESGLFHDPTIILRVPLWQERYAGVLLDLGASLGLGDTKDWTTAHGGPGAIVGLGWSAPLPVLDMLAFRANARYTIVTDAEQELYTTGDLMEGEYQEVLVGAGVDWRLNRSLSVGATATYQVLQWEDSFINGQKTGTEEIVTSWLGGYGRLQWPDRWFTTISIAGEGLTNTDQDKSVSISIRLEGSPW